MTLFMVRKLNKGRLSFLTMNGAEIWMIHLCGLMLMAGRLVHYYGLRNREVRWRRSGMAATYSSLLLLVLANIFYLPWDLIFRLH